MARRRHRPGAIAAAVAEVVDRRADDPESLRRITDTARDRVCALHDSRVQAEELAALIAAPAEELEVAS